jgi:hypothetical protein
VLSGSTRSSDPNRRDQLHLELSWWRRQNTEVSVASKLQIKPGSDVVVLHQPDGVDLELSDDHTTVDDPGTADTIIFFVTNRRELDERARPFVEAASRDALAWLAYPKAGQLDTDLNRDTLWELLGVRGIRPVRQIAIDDTWTALRFRPGVSSPPKR